MPKDCLKLSLYTIEKIMYKFENIILDLTLFMYNEVMNRLT